MASLQFSNTALGVVSASASVPPRGVTVRRLPAAHTILHQVIRDSGCGGWALIRILTP